MLDSVRDRDLAIVQLWGQMDEAHHEHHAMTERYLESAMRELARVRGQYAVLRADNEAKTARIAALEVSKSTQLF